MRGSALIEFALAWPVALLLVLGCVEIAVWEAEAYAARSAALAGARAASVAGADPRVAQEVARRSLAPSLAGASPAAWCPGEPGSPRVWVCVSDRGTAVEVVIGGSVPTLVPWLGSQGMPLHADVWLEKERFTS